VFPMDDDEGWVLPVSRFKSAKISTIKTHGTSHAVAAPVDNFPFLSPDNRRHEPHGSETTTTPPFRRNSSSIALIDASHHAHTSCDLEGFSPPIFCKCPFFCRGTCPTAASLRQKQSASLPCPTTYRSISIDDAPPQPNTALPQRQPVDLTAIQAEIRANLAKINRIFPPPMTTTMTTPPPLRQPDPSLSSPIPSSTKPIEPPHREPIDLAAIQDEIHASLATLDRLFPPSRFTMMTLPSQHSEPPLPIPTPPAPTETEATVTPFLPLRTRIERLLSNLLPSNPVLWMLDIVYRRVPQT